MKELLAKYLNPVFVATMLETGDILQAALDAGFNLVLGATTSTPDAQHCQERFKGQEKIKIFAGEEIILFDVIQEYNLEITFCLDARSEPAPALIHELATIKHHRIKSHTFLIQNTDILGTAEAAWLTYYQVQMALREINHLYRFIHQESDHLLIATITQ